MHGNKYTQEEFINILIKKHGNKYNYSTTIYTGIKDKINVLCEKHGIFNIQASSHLSGCGCNFCNLENRTKTTEQFIKEANLVHNFKYDYSKTKYVKSINKVKIICKEHGEFNQIPDSHLRGCGCPLCSMGGTGRGNKFSNIEKERLIKKYDNNLTNNFIIKANKIHNKLYKYENSKYELSSSKINITCRIHGEFKQTPNKHLFGHGCPKCGGSDVLTTEEFILKANKIYNNLFDYNEVDYINADTKIRIKCKEHGIFEQMPRNHYKTGGCPICNLSNGELLIKNSLNKLNIKYKTQYGFKDLKYVKSLRFDFGIIDDDGKLQYLIEYNGKQHYEYIEFFHRNLENLELYKLKDKIKKEYCAKNNIELIIIKYDQYEKINEILNAKHCTKSTEQV